MKVSSFFLAAASLLTVVSAIPAGDNHGPSTTAKVSTTTSAAPAATSTESIVDWVSQGFYDLVISANDTASDIAFLHYNENLAENANGLALNYTAWYQEVKNFRATFQNRVLLNVSYIISYWDNTHRQGSLARQIYFTGYVNGTKQLVNIDTVLQVAYLNSSYTIIQENFVYVYAPTKL